MNQLNTITPAIVGEILATYGTTVCELTVSEPACSEQLMHYLWFGRHFNPCLHTTTGKTVEVLSTGQPNHHAGPDVFNALLKIDGIVWAGNVEFHVYASDWWRHMHQLDHAYDSVILHVVLYDDDTVMTASGLTVEQLVLTHSASQENAYTNMDSNLSSCLPCRQSLPIYDRNKLVIWLEQLMIRRLERKIDTIENLLRDTMNDWDEAFYIMLMRNLGFSTNADAFEALARSLPLKTIFKHRDGIEMLEAFLFGQASMLDAPQDIYSAQLQRNYQFLRVKFSLTPIENSRFKYLRMRPCNFPEVRLAQMAQLLYQHDRLFTKFLSCANTKAIYHLFDCTVSDYWKTHYRFGKESVNRNKNISKSSVDNIIINTVVPFMFCYGKHYQQESLCERAVELLTSLPAEKNNIVKQFTDLGVAVEHAGHSQAVIEVYRSFCESHQCHLCAVGKSTSKTS